MAKKKKAKVDEPELDEPSIDETPPVVDTLHIDNGLMDAGEAVHVIVDGKIIETYQDVESWRVAVERYRALTNK